MKLRRLSIIPIVIAAFSLCACHGSKGPAPFTIPEEFDTTGEYNITFWAKNDTNKTQTEIYQNAINDFESIYPNIHVTLRLYTDYSRIYNDVITNISTNTTPNVCITYPDHIATYITGKNTVVGLNDLLIDSNYGLGGSKVAFDAPTKDEIIPQFLEECKLGDTYYALPYMRSTEALYINKTYVEKMGYEIPDDITWDFIWDVSEAAMQKDSDGNFSVNGQNIMIPFIYKSTDNMMIQMLRQLNAGYSDGDGNILIFNDDTKQILDTVATHAKSGAFSTFKISSYPSNFLNAGQSIFAIDSTAGATWMGTYAPLSDISPDKFVEFETIVRPVPQFDPANPQMISQGPSICVFNKENPQEVLASWLFVQYMLTNDVQIAYSQTEGYVPVTQKAQQSPEYTEYLAQKGSDQQLHYDVKINASEVLLNNTEHTFITPVFNRSASLRNAAGELIESVTKSVRRKENIDDAYYEKLFEETKALYHLSSAGALASSSTDIKALGTLPSTAIWLLICIAVTWVGIITYLIYDWMKKRKK